MLNVATELPETIVAVSLKLYFDHDETVSWATRVATMVRSRSDLRRAGVGAVILPGAASLGAVVAAGRGAVQVGAQDVSWAERGAYTGEISARQLFQVGCRYVEVGHAERRRLFHEDDRIVAQKLAAGARAGLVPLLCAGEPTQGDPEAAAAHVVAQADAALALIDEPTRLVVAYEPVWAIGGARSAPVEHIRAVSAAIRESLARDPRVSDFRVLYGGSAGPGLLPELGDAVDGLFLGRSAHDVGALARVLDEAVDHPTPIRSPG